ncbi:glycosyltransferase [Lapillicoccus sp.]|uniref:glycosyltransferase n=1 Tax=Lapillicoccus sp. TaxID=1909287 RepID=UPI0025F84DFC|nr:glycosyltransferase [Lapillicoccus sp.]
MTGVLVHEWIAQSGGSENVLEAMSGVFPEADVVCLWNDSTGRFQPESLHETWLSRTPLRRSKMVALPFMMPTWKRRADRGYDWALISSHLFAHHARFGEEGPDFRRFVYVHTPARYIWSPELDGRGQGRVARGLASVLKPLDRRAAKDRAHRTSYAANSAFIRDRIADCWQVPSRVIYPPVDVTAIQSVDDWRTRLTDQEQHELAALPKEFVLGASRFVPYKRLDLVIRAGEAAGRPVVLAGRGPELRRLQELAREASVPVHFVDYPSTELLHALYQATAVLVFPAIEDFGIMPVEAMAAGAPVLAHQIGGTAETVLPGETGALTDFRSAAEICEGVETAVSTEREARRVHAAKFSTERFAAEVRSWVEES